MFPPRSGEAILGCYVDRQNRQAFHEGCVTQDAWFGETGQGVDSNHVGVWEAEADTVLYVLSRTP